MDESGLRRESSGKEEKKVRRESLGRDFEKKLCINPEISIQKCRDDIALYSVQTETFFNEERGLAIGGLNPKFAADVAFVTDADVEGLFGKCTKLRTTNTFLKPEARKDLLDLYSKIYGSSSVTNNEFAGWVVKGYIANLKKRSVNWALAASTTAQEKADRAQRQLFRLLNPESSEDASASGLKLSTCTSQGDGIGGRSTGAMVKTERPLVSPASCPSGLGFGSLCPYGVPSDDLQLVRGVREVEGEMLLIAASKAKFLEAEYRRISDKLVGFKFTMDDRRSIAKEDEEKVLQFQAEFKRASKAVLEYELQGIGISIGSAEYEDFAQQLLFLRSNKGSVEKRLQVSQSVAESSRARAIKGEDSYHDIEEEAMRAESDLQVLRREIVDMNRHNTAVQEQCVQMDQGGGLSLWPKHALHPAMAEDAPQVTGSLQLHPCAFCNRGYPYFDIVVASCRHIYHIFCASALAKVDNRCSRCGEIFHPHWWQNFGFRCAYSEFEEETNRLQLHAELEELKRSLKENGTRHVMNWSQSSLKHSDRGSCGSLPVSFGPVNGGPCMTATGVSRLPSLASFTPSEELHATDTGFDISNFRGQEVDSPVKNRGVQVHATASDDGTVTPERVVDAARELEENSILPSVSELPNTRNVKCALLKRAADLQAHDGDWRKKVALNSSGEKSDPMAVDIGVIIESDAEERPQSTTENLATEKDKSKGKQSKRKAPPSASAGRVSTRAELKKNLGKESVNAAD